MDIDVGADAQATATAAAIWLAREIGSAVERRGRCSIALSGGTTPTLMFAPLADLGVAWSKVHLLQVDERVAPDGHADRNATALLGALVEPAGIPPGNVSLMPVTDADLDGAAGRYAGLIAGINGGVFDIVHLGIGPDGHTASWPPGDPVVDIRDRDVAVVGPFNGRVRMTLTVPIVNRARRIMFLITGADKAVPLHRMLAGDHELPASRVRHDDVVVFADRAAARPPHDDEM